MFAVLEDWFDVAGTIIKGFWHARSLLCSICAGAFLLGVVGSTYHGRCFCSGRHWGINIAASKGHLLGGDQSHFFSILWFLMSQPLKSMINTYVFVGFHFLKIFVVLMTSGTSWDLILDTLGGLERPLTWFVGVLHMHWNLIDFQGHPKLRLRTWRVTVQGVL